MSKKSIINREIKRKKLNILFHTKRFILKNKIKTCKSLEELYYISKKLQKLPRNSSLTRIHNRCSITNRPRSYYRFFGLSRIILRNLALNCFLPGVTKSSW